MYVKFLRANLFTFLAIISFVFLTGCSAEVAKTPAEILAANTAAEAAKNAEPVYKGATIDIKPNSPAETVKAFYDDLREKRFREALFLTNLRPAIEGLTDAELKEFQVDFEAIAKHVPTQIEINGEVISGDSATVTAKLPSEDLDKSEIQKIGLRRENGVWIILTVDETAEKVIKREGKNYFYALRIETHENEVRDMLDRLAKAQLAYSVQNQGLYGGIPELVKAELLPADIQSSESTGYNYSIRLSPDKQTYSAGAVPAVYGKTGKLSFAVEFAAKNRATLTSKDLGGKPLMK
jgi:hypothetical protein